MEKMLTYACPNCDHTNVLRVEDLFTETTIACENCNLTIPMSQLTQIKNLAMGLVELENSKPIYQKTPLKCYINIPISITN